MIEDICHKLKEKRLKLGYTIGDVAVKTKLHPSILKYIEDCNLSSIGPAYIKGFIRIYASFLGVELGEDIENINSSKQGIQKKESFKKANDINIIDSIFQMVRQLSPEVKRKVFIIFAGILLLGSGLVAVRFTVVKISKMIESRTRVKETEIAAEPVVASSVKSVEQAKQAEQNEQAKDIVVSITAKKKCFLKAIVDGKLLFEGVLSKGAVESWRGDKEIEFKIGDGSAVYLEVNGKAIPTLTSIRKPIKSLKITSSGISIDK